MSEEIKTLSKLLHERLPGLMAEFNKSPWSYEIYAPSSFDDPAILVVHLSFGNQRCERSLEITIDAATGNISLRTTSETASD